MLSLKKLLPSLLLIFIYFITDEFFGPIAGLCCALILGCAEFIYTRIKEKTTDWLVVLMTLFFCIPGIITLWAEDSIFASLQNGIIESGLCLLLGVFAFSNTDLTAALPASSRKTIQLNQEQQKTMRATMKILFLLLCLHTLLVFVSVFLLDNEKSNFISGPLLYILIGGFFLFLFLRNKWNIHKYKQEEWLPLVNEKGEVTGQAPRSICHSGSKLLHPVVHLHILNEKKEIFLQKRSMKKDLLPGIWDTAVGGHISVNEKVEDALKRETFEELGITNFEARFNDSYIWESPREKELVFSFLCTRYDQIRIDNDEVDEGRFWSKAEIETGIGRNMLTPNFVHEYRTILHKFLN